MTTEADLRANVIAAPDDDFPRLVYADWCEEHGQADRADFIRTQCALASGEISAEEREQLVAREQELLDVYAYEWAKEFRKQIGEWTYHRGFIERVHTCLEVPAEEIKTLLNRAPIRHLRDTTQLDDLSGVLGALPQLEQLTGLEFWSLYGIEDEEVRQLLTSPSLSNLRTLILHHDRNGRLVSEDVIVEALGSPNRKNLTELAVNVDCSWRGPSDAILRAIAESPYLRNLKRLNISNAGDPGNASQISRETVHALADSPNLANLEFLDVRATYALRDFWDAVRDRLCQPGLQELWLCGACQVPRGSRYPILGQLADLPKWRDTFEAQVDHVDWEQRFVDPSFGGVWKGYS